MNKLKVANSVLQSARDAHERDYKLEIEKLDVKEKELLRRINQLDESKQKIAQVHGDVDATDGDLVEINAGGKVIALTRSTLTQFKGTRLEALFSGRWDKKLIRDGDGRIFLDTNPICFQAIVDYLNDAKISSDKSPAAPPSVDPEYEDILMHQLDLFGLSDRDSVIVRRPNHVKLIDDWLNDDNLGTGLTLLYRSSRDGREDSTFHSKCDGKGPTLTVIETTNGHIIGGYSDVSWGGSQSYQHSSKAFLFAISGDGSFTPSKMKLTGNGNQYAIYCHSSSGPTFGSGHNLQVKGSSLYLNIGNIYQPPPHPISGGRTFQIKEMEVFQVDQQKKLNLDKIVLDSGRKVEEFSRSINAAINQKWAALEELEMEIIELEANFSDEEKFVTFFSRKSEQDVVVLNVCGTLMTTTRGTLQLYDDSSLASKVLDINNDSQKPVEKWNAEDVVAWLNTVEGLASGVIKSFEEDGVTGRELLYLGKEGLKDFGVTKRGTIFYLLSESEKLKYSKGGTTILIEHSPYCIEKIVDHLRLESMFVKGLIDSKPGAPVVRASEKSRFEKVVQHYFSGDECNALLGK